MPKTTISVREKRWELFNRECKAASFRRDEFLNRVLSEEIHRLEAIPACDEAGERWLKANWITYWSSADTSTRPVPLLLSTDILEALNSACRGRRVPRDAFLDCALEFLTSRIYEAALVVKNPRTTKDLASRVGAILEESEGDDVQDSERRRWLIDEVTDWSKSRNLDSLRDDFYSLRLHHTTELIAEREQILRALDML